MNDDKETNTNDDVLTFDEILQDPAYQAEFDKRVAKAIEKANSSKSEEWKKKEDDLLKRETEMRQNIMEEMEQKRRQAEEDAKLTAEQRYKNELDIANSKISTYEKQIATRKRQDKVNAYIEDKGYDAKIAKFIDVNDITDEQVEAKVDEVNTMFSESVSKAVNDKLKENPDVILGAKKKSDEPQFNFDFQSVKE